MSAAALGHRGLLAIRLPRMSVGWMLWSAAGCGAEDRLDGIVVVSLDTLRADRLGAYGSDRGLTPNLDRFASEAVIFDLAFAQANETLFSHASLFTSRYPSELDRLDAAFRLPNATPTLASLFAGAGWATGAFVAGGHLSSAFGLGVGFSTYDDRESWGSLRDTGRHALDWLDARGDEPFFAFIHGYDTHDRYLKPPPFGYLVADAAYSGPAAALVRTPGATSRVVAGFASADPDGLHLLSLIHPRFEAGRAIAAIDPAAVPLDEADLAHVAGVYDGSVAWADAAFGLLMAGLESRDLLDRVAIVVVSDHGEELGEEEGCFNHRFSLSDATLRVPLLVRLPGGRGGGRRATGLAELTDVAPTLWELAGIAAPNGAAGRSLVPVLRGAAATGRDFAFSEGALRLLSVRSADARLVAEGLSIDNPLAPGLLAAAPLDGVSLSLAGPESEADRLRGALVAQLGALELAAGMR